MEVDWDLQAVVRGCTGASSSSTTTSSSSSSAGLTTIRGGNYIKSETSPHLFYSRLSFGSELQAGRPFSLPVPDPFEARQSGNIGDLHELFRPFFPISQPPQVAHAVSSLSTLCFSKEHTQLKVQKHPPATKLLLLPSRGGGSLAPTTNSQRSRSKRRKNQLKRVCHVPAEALSSDVWAWRKYGQKPIKGSPYPRGYYRCSSSKGCLARKQVERNRSDPRMFIVTYTAEHNHPAPTHRNSLAGSTRQKAIASPASPCEDADKGSPATKPTFSSSPVTSPEDDLPPLSTNTESREDKDLMEDDEVEQEEDFDGFPDTDEVNDDFFAGLEDIAAANDRFPDHFTGSFGLPWLPSTAATTAGGL